MLSKYRLGYLAVAVGLMGGVAFVSAESETPDGAQSPIARAIQKYGERILGSKTAVEGAEPGNLSEAGATELVSDASVEAALKASDEQPILIFKHSTACEVSGAAYRSLREWLKAQGDAAPRVFLVKVVEHKPVSQRIASRLDVQHESPQIILVQDEQAVWYASHEAVTPQSVTQALEQHITHRDRT